MECLLRVYAVFCAVSSSGSMRSLMTTVQKTQLLAATHPFSMWTHALLMFSNIQRLLVQLCVSRGSKVTAFLMDWLELDTERAVS